MLVKGATDLLGPLFPIVPTHGFIRHIDKIFLWPNIQPSKSS